jgi:hypothetical protein
MFRFNRNRERSIPRGKRVMALKYSSKFSKELDGGLVDDTYLGTDKYDRVNSYPFYRQL